MSSGRPETRIRILKASLELLEASQGAQGADVRMTDIARSAGVTRQALYLHFATRAELLIATTHYLDDLKGIEDRLQVSRAARTGTERLEAFIDAWGSYIPEIYGVAKALLAMKDTDEAAANAWDKRMQDVREGCEAAIKALKRDGMLSPDHSARQATDILWTMLSVRNWEQLTIACGWSQKKYVETLKSMARSILVAPGPSG